jgi:CheY-like chemotaxis protein
MGSSATGKESMMHILYVEDDPLLRKHVSDQLTRANHNVVEACNGAQACWLLNYHRAALDLLITDINLGSDLDGWTVAEHARDVSSDIAVIYATGSKFDHPLVKNSIALPKPFSAPALENAINQACGVSPRMH